MAKARRGRSKAFMKALRKKYGLGEFKRKKTPSGSRAARPRLNKKRARRYEESLKKRYPGESAKEGFLKDLESGEYFAW